MLDWAVFASAVVLGLASSFHCLGMCGPIVLALPYGGQRPWLNRTLHHLGRATTYALFGAVVGALGMLFSLFSYQQLLSVLSGVTILALAVIGSRRTPKVPVLGGFFAFVNRKLQGLLKLMEGRSLLFFAFGMLNGALPCGVVYLALAAAAGTGDWHSGAAYMFIFGLGTLPMMLALSLGGRMLGYRMAKLKNYARYASVAVALLFVARGLNLGVPYISPKSEAATGKPACCSAKESCHK